MKRICTFIFYVLSGFFGVAHAEDAVIKELQEKLAQQEARLGDLSTKLKIESTSWMRPIELWEQCEYCATKNPNNLKLVICKHDNDISLWAFSEKSPDATEKREGGLRYNPLESSGDRSPKLEPFYLDDGGKLEYGNENDLLRPRPKDDFLIGVIPEILKWPEESGIPKFNSDMAVGYRGGIFVIELNGELYCRNK